MQQKQEKIKTGLKVAGILLAGAFLIGLTLHCIVNGLAMLQDRTTHEMGEMLPLVPAQSATEPAAQAAPPEPTAPPAEERPAPEPWMLTLVNAWNPVPENFAVELAEVERGYEMDARAVEPLQRMLADCRAEGLKPMICSAYRTNEYQTTLFNKQVRKQKWCGLDAETAVTAAAEVVAQPGTSEHQIGLAADICSQNYQLLDEKQEETPEFQWLRTHCAEYGFILRYPPGTTALTGIIYEPWHFRYVGETAAQEITEAGITLEEYLNKTDHSGKE